MSINLDEATQKGLWAVMKSAAALSLLSVTVADETMGVWRGIMQNLLC